MGAACGLDRGRGVDVEVLNAVICKPTLLKLPPSIPVDGVIFPLLISHTTNLPQ